ncbi:zinc finger protein 425-like isoform X2 [Plodia interpunctella]|uniref:zinc finger protein 425-like isoform X2 n=1 Tax=Plodia interpunctella TaxID=58824 RepID=UPI00236755F8|nr:zinc finger protein 425-like isoform X2 [Plodia interpunctella]
MEMEDFSLCRTCLEQSSLHPIFVDCIDQTEYSNAIFVTTGLKVAAGDGLPQKMCTECVAFLNNCMKFRQKCRDSEAYLLNLKKELEWKKSCNSVQAEVTETMLDDSDDDDIPLRHLIEKNSDCGQLDLKTGPHKTTGKTGKEKNKNKSAVNKKEAKLSHLYEILDASGRRVRCKLCLRELSVRSVSSHVSRAHPHADRARVACELCERRVTREKLKRHVMLAHGADAGTCVYCKREFGRAALVAHARGCEQKRKARKPSAASRQLSQCSSCHKTMQTASLRAHQRRHAGLAPVCEYCGQRLSNKLRLLEHLRAKHGLDQLRCSRCDFRCASLTALRCPLCPATFKANNSLHTHKLSVHGSALFRCGQCGRGYRARHYAVRHLRQVHRYTGDSPPVTKETMVLEKNIQNTT